MGVDGAWPGEAHARTKNIKMRGAEGYPVWLVLMQIFTQSTNTATDAIHMRSMLPLVI
jgi:hypothetical protein